MVLHVFGTLGAIALAALLFSIPLVLKFHVYKPETKHVAPGDTFMLDGQLSTVWCQAVEVTADASFESYAYESYPAISRGVTERLVMTHPIVLPNRAQEYRGFHLLRGSRVNISSCVRLFAADLTVVKGYGALKRCLREHKHHFEKNNDISGEDSASESESDDVTSSISSSQGAISNETDRMYVCKNALHHFKVPNNYACRATDKSPVRKYTLTHLIEETGRYYYIFASNTFLDIIPNEFSVEFVIDRTSYDYDTSVGNCSSGDSCVLDLSLGSDEKIVVQMDPFNGTLKKNTVTVACKPREGIFCLFYAGFMIVIFLCAFQ